MLQQELPRIDSTPLDGWGRWLVPALISGLALTAAVVSLLLAQPAFAAIAAVGAVVAGVAAYLRESRGRSVAEPIVGGPDFSLVGSALGMCRDAAALTSENGTLLIANAAYRERFEGSLPPLQLGDVEDSKQGLEIARSMAWRDGAGCTARVKTSHGSVSVEVERVGAHNDLLLWRFIGAAPPDVLAATARRVSGATGERLAAAGLEVDYRRTEEFTRHLKDQKTRFAEIIRKGNIKIE